MWSAITAGDLSPIFGVGSGVGFSGAASAEQLEIMSQAQVA